MKKTTLLRSLVAGIAAIAGGSALNGQVLFFEPFNTSMGQMTVNSSSFGSWQYNNSCPGSVQTGHSGPGNAMFIGSGCQFGNGGNTVSGNMDSPNIAIPSSGANLTFKYRLNTECGASVCSFDVLTVQASTNNFVSATTIAASNTSALTPNGSTWGTITFPLTAFAGQTIKLRFNFNSIDGISNAIDGVYVDDITVNGFTSASITGLPTTACSNGSPVTMTATPSGGTFSGPGVTGSTFNPSTAGAGTHTIAYVGPASSQTYSVFTGLSLATLTGATTAVSLGDDQVSAGITMPFAFNFYGTPYSTIYISSNGFLTFNNNPNSGCCSGGVIPSTASPNNIISGSWNDLNPGGVGINYFTAGTAPNRVFCVNFASVSHFGGGGTPITLQYQLHENNGVIEIHSTNNITDGSNQTMGLENATGTAGVAPTGRNSSTTFNVVNEMTRFVPFIPSTIQTVTVSAPPTVTSTASPTAICTGASTSLSASGANTYVWNPGNLTGANQTLSPTSTTTYTVTGTNTTTGCTNTSTVAVTVNPLPTVSATAANGTICDGATETLTASGASTYVWSSGGTAATETVTPNTTTTYTVTGTDANGCSNTANVTVNVNALPTVTASALAGTVCDGTNDTLNASGATSYVWSSGGTAAQEIVTPSTTTTYTVTGTDANGCVNTATATVNVNALPTVAATAMAGTVCDGTNDTLDATGASTYVWSSGGTAAQEIVTPNTTTTYTVTGTDANGCVNTATVTVNVNALPVVNLGADVTQCAGTVVLDAQNTGSTYVWSTGGTAQTDTVSMSGSYDVTVTDVNGCVNSDTINVTINANPVVNLGADSTQCGGTVMVDAGNPGSTYMWNDNSTAQTLVINATGTYYVDVTDPNGCMGSDTINVTINTLPTVTGTASASTVCLDDADVTLTGSPTGGAWSGPGVTGNNFDPSVGAGAQNLVYSFTDANGCSSADTVTVTVNACVGFEEATLAAGVNLYPNPNNGAFTLAVNANVGDMVIEVMDMQGRLVFKSNENNVQTGYTKQITLENQASGMYMVRMTTANEMHIVKVSVQK